MHEKEIELTVKTYKIESKTFSSDWLKLISESPWGIRTPIPKIKRKTSIGWSETGHKKG